MREMKIQLIKEMADNLLKEVDDISNLIIKNNLINEQFAISWNDCLNEISTRF